ncbi:MAG: amidohydrolase family protein [Afipia sp.]|nr:amidohydrolase family protein [Afipia sp.]
MKQIFRRGSKRTVALLLSLLAVPEAAAQVPEAAASPETLFRNVRVLDVVKGQLGAPTNVLVADGRIARIGGDVTPRGQAKIIEGGGRTLMPGMIDMHVHLTFSALTMQQMMSPDLTPDKAEAAAGRQAHDMLLRGFTSVRDAGGPVFGLKRRIDAGQLVGPRVWPSGAVISQTSGHGDFRMPNERSRKFGGGVSRSELFGANFIADGTSEVLTATRENLRFGASQIKLMAGGGTSSDYDPIDVTQYTFEEMKAAVDAAEDWNSYVMVHAYTPRAVRRAIDAGVKCIEHGHLLDEATLRLMADKGIWLSTQTLSDDSPNVDPARREKRREILANNAALWQNAKQLGVKLAWGTDFLFDPALNAEQNDYLVRLKSWFTPAEIVKMVTYDNAQLLALSGPRSPYRGALGVVQEGALADLLLVDGNPLAQIDLLGDPKANFDVIMKGGTLYKGVD